MWVVWDPGRTTHGCWAGRLGLGPMPLVHFVHFGRGGAGHQFGIPAGVIKLFSGGREEERKAEQALADSGLPYTIIRWADLAPKLSLVFALSFDFQITRGSHSLDTFVICVMRCVRYVRDFVQTVIVRKRI